MTDEQIEYIEQRLSAGPYHPASDGELRIFVRGLLDALREAKRLSVVCRVCGRAQPRLVATCDDCF